MRRFHHVAQRFWSIFAFIIKENASVKAPSTRLRAEGKDVIYACNAGLCRSTFSLYGKLIAAGAEGMNAGRGQDEEMI